MKNRRLLIGLLTTCALLAQSWAIAGMGPMIQPPVQAPLSADSAMPCHGSAAPDQAALPDCCQDGTSCAQVCAGATGMVSTVSPPAFTPAIEPMLVPPASRVAAAHTLTPLRPPITSQS